MKYKIADVKQVLQDKDFDVFVHGCNAQGKFESGVAGIVREVYPYAAFNYELAIQDECTELGSINSIYVVKDDIPVPKVILNAITQENYGYDGKRYASYDAIDDLFKLIAEEHKAGSITYPLIGCGLGGLQWNVVKEIINHRLKGLDHCCIVRVEDIVKHNLLDAVDQLWEDLGNIPCSGLEEQLIEEPFLHFTVGEDIENIWHWFEEVFNISVGKRYF